VPKADSEAGDQAAIGGVVALGMTAIDFFFDTCPRKGNVLLRRRPRISRRNATDEDGPTKSSARHSGALALNPSRL
jgi:hypothetical protein